MAAVRYLEDNPVAAAWFRRPTIRPWSSARSHINGRCNKDDPLTGVAVQEAGDLEAEGLAIADAIVIRLRTSRLPQTTGSIKTNQPWAAL